MYKSTQIVYCKYNNSKYNKFKDTTYFAGLFMPRDIITDKFKSKLQLYFKIFKNRNYYVLHFKIFYNINIIKIIK